LAIGEKGILLLSLEHILVIHVWQQTDRRLAERVTAIFENAYHRDCDDGVDKEKVFHAEKKSVE
jgi:hypothetical protein